MSVIPILAVPDAFDGEVGFREVEMTDWGVECVHDLDLRSDRSLPPEERVRKYMEWLSGRFSSVPVTRVGTVYKLGTVFTDAAETFGVQGMEPDGVLLEGHVVSGRTGEVCLIRVVVKGEAGVPSWRLLRAMDLAAAYFQPWGGDLQIRGGRVCEAVGRFRMTHRMGVPDEDTETAALRLWQFCRVELGLSVERIRDLFELGPDVTNFRRLR